MQERERVLSALSHDMKNLVGAVDMNLQLIPLMLESSSTPHAPVSEFLERAHQAALGIGNLIDDFVAWFRLQEGGGSAGLELDSDLNLGRLSTLVQAEFTTMIETQGLVFKLDVEGEAAAVLPGHGTPWRVLRLLMQHCLRFLFPQQTLSVRLWARADGSFELSVATTQEGVFEMQGRGLAWLLAQDFAASSNGTLTLAAGSDDGEMAVIRWV